MERDGPYTRELVAFAEALRDRGVTIAPDEVATAARALTYVDPLDRDQFYHALRTTLVDDPAEIPVFEVVFAEFWEDAPSDAMSGAETIPSRSEREQGSDERGSGDSGSGPPPGGPDGERGSVGDDEAASDSRRRVQTVSEGSPLDGAEETAMAVGRQESTEHVDVAILDDERDLTELALLVTDFGRQVGALRGFRQRSHPTGAVDLRRSLSVAREQTPETLPRVEARRTEANVRFFVDVSRSMLQNMDQSFLLVFLFECARQFADVRVFMFDTSATEVTRHFRTAGVGRTVAEMRRAQTEWGAGTTIGSCLADILTADSFVVDRDTVAVVVSDGWDAGDVDLLEAQMRHLERRCRSVIWFNPRASSDRYEPAVAGMEAVLPYVDHFLPFSTIGDLRDAVDYFRSSVTIG